MVSHQCSAIEEFIPALSYLGIPTYTNFNSYRGFSDVELKLQGRIVTLLPSKLLNISSCPHLPSVIDLIVCACQKKDKNSALSSEA